METPTNDNPETELPKHSAPSIDLSPDEIIAGLDVWTDDSPVQAIHAAREKRDLIIPRLIEVIRQATAAARAGHSPQGNAHFLALFLLAEFKAKEAAPAIVEAVSLPGRRSFELFGDAMDVHVASILAYMIGDRLEAIDELIRNRELDLSIRWEVATTYVELVADDRLLRDEAVRRLQAHLREAIENKDAEIAGPLVSVLLDLEGREALPEIETAFGLDLVDECVVCREEVEFAVDVNEPDIRDQIKRRARGPIDDTIAELEHWICVKKSAGDDEFAGDILDDDEFVDDEFGEDEFDDEAGDDSLSDDERREYEALWRSQTSPFTPLVPRPRLEDSPLMPAEPFAAGTVRHTAPRVGRNDPCTCGSGKKFKKCCGAKR